MKIAQVALVSSLMMICFLGIFRWFNEPDTEETITFFPLDKTAQFVQMDTSLHIAEKKKNGEWYVQWETSSDLGKPSYLRQDVSLLFVNGVLKGKMNKWEEKTNSIALGQRISGKKNSFLQAVSYHHAEIHQGEDAITSAQGMSKDHLYVISPDRNELMAFKQPINNREKTFKRMLDELTSKEMKQTVDRALQQYNLLPENYHLIPLTDLPDYAHKPLPGLTVDQTQTVIGNLWEGLYKNYILGIKKEDGTIASPVNSSVPLIFLPKTTKLLYLIIELDNGELVKLQQVLP